MIRKLSCVCLPFSLLVISAMFGCSRPALPRSDPAPESNSKLIYFGYSNHSETQDDTIGMVRIWGSKPLCPNWKSTINRQNADYQILFGPSAGEFTMIGKRGEVMYSGGMGPLYMPNGNPDGSGVNLCKMTQ